MPITLTDPEIQRGSELLWALENAIDAQPEEVKMALADARADFHGYLNRVYRRKDGHFIPAAAAPSEALQISASAASVIVLSPITPASGGTGKQNNPPTPTSPPGG